MGLSFTGNSGLDSGVRFEIVELDCLLIHWSSMGVDDELTPDTSPIDLLDRLSRGDVNMRFYGRSGLVFEAAIESGSLTNTVQTLDRSSEPEVVTIKSKRVVRVGNGACRELQRIHCVRREVDK